MKFVQAELMAGVCLMLFLAPLTTAENAKPQDHDANIHSIAERCQLWINVPNKDLRSLRYTYKLGNDERQVELVQGISQVCNGMWQGTTLYTGLHSLLRYPDKFSVTPDVPEKAKVAPANPRFIVRPKPPVAYLSLEIGNGIESSWRGYFSQGSKQMILEIDARSRLPVCEIHDGTEIRYGSWEEAKPDCWIPREVKITHDEAAYVMHFAWVGNTAWILTQAETVSNGVASTIATVRDVAVNDQALIDRFQADADQRKTAAGTLKSLLDHNQPWLSDKLNGLDSIRYTFHIVREDVKETGYLDKEGLAIFELVHDGQGKMKEELGNRKFVLAEENNQWATAPRDAKYATLYDPDKDSRRGPYPPRLRHYARIGCQLDLPIFQAPGWIDRCKIEITEGMWKEQPCRIFTIHHLSRDSELGVGTMLGFTSWSYVPHVWPDKEVLYFEKERPILLHEMITARDAVYEIDYGNYKEVEANQWAPLSIHVHSPDHFTANYRFQLVDKKHWLLEHMQSWFDPKDKSQGIVSDVVINKSAREREALLAQVAAFRKVFEEKPAAPNFVKIPTFTFQLGTKWTVQEWQTTTTVDSKANLVIRCETLDKGKALQGYVMVLFLDDNGQLLRATQSAINKEGIAETVFKDSASLNRVKRIAIGIPEGQWLSAESGSTEVAVFPFAAAKANQINVPDDAQGLNRAIQLELNRDEQTGTLSAKIDLLSREMAKELALDVSVCLLTTECEPVAAAQATGSILTEYLVTLQTRSMELPQNQASADPVFALIGVTRGDTIGARRGRSWLRLERSRSSFSIETLFAAEDEACWRLALDQVRRDDLRRELRGMSNKAGQSREHARKELRTIESSLAPYRPHLLRIVSQAEQADTIDKAARLLGYTKPQGAEDSLRTLLKSNDTTIQEGAAIGLALMGKSVDVEPLRRALGKSANTWDRDEDVAFALLRIGEDDVVTIAGQQLLTELRCLVLIPDTQGRLQVTGNRSKITFLVNLLACSEPRTAFHYLTAAVSYLDGQPELYAECGDLSIPRALVGLGSTSHSYVEAKIRSGDLAFFAELSQDQYYLPVVREQILRPDANQDVIYRGVSYLQNLGGQAATATLRELWQKRSEDDSEFRLFLCRALVGVGDMSGLDEAFTALVVACTPESPPDDPEKRWRWDRDQERRRRDSLAVFRGANIDATTELLAKHATNTDLATQEAVLSILAQLRQVPRAVQPNLRTWQKSRDRRIASQATLLLSSQ